MPELEYRALRPGEWEPFFALVEAAFGFRDLFERYVEEDSRLGEHETLLALDGERPVSCVQIFEKDIRLRGRTVGLGGIGSVATHPDYERRGIATRVLENAIAEMRRRGMALSLLFTGRISFYERLDWIQVPYPCWAIHGGEPTASGARRFQASDLGRVRALYERFNADLEATTVRDERYWGDQLRYAGNPDESIWVVERDGIVVAYARVVKLGARRVSEYAFAPGAQDDLARLLVERSPEGAALLVDRVPDRDLEAALRRRAARVDPIELPDMMWRVLDRRALLELAALPAATPDRELLRALVAHDRARYWVSDRF